MKYSTPLFFGLGRSLPVLAGLTGLGVAAGSGCGSTIDQTQTSANTSSSGSPTSVTTGSSMTTGSGSSTSSSGAGGAAPGPAPTKIDLLFVVANDAEMLDKQEMLALSLPSLIDGLLNPACVDGSGTPVPASMQPGPTGACPTGTTRDFPVITDVHIGLLSSSLGTFGADGCPDIDTASCAGGVTNTSTNDHGHLITRTDPCGAATVPTYQSQGFLAWDPSQKLTPPGLSQLDGTGGGTLVSDATALTEGVGAVGCGFPSQNEAWYRFLVDPAPYLTITLNGNSGVVTSGVDTTLLAQRAEFLRPDSLLAIVQVSDKPETSIKEYSQYPLFAETSLHLPLASSACTSGGPNDPCCYSCGQAPPNGCTADPICAGGASYTTATENVAIRAFGLSAGVMSQKSRYGLEFFYQPSRYVQGLTSAMVLDSQGTMVANPIFMGGRDPSLVFYAAIVGVPWQLIARQVNGTPDLINGVSALDPTQIGGFKTAAELDLKDPKGQTFWADIAGQPETYVSPLSPFMQESTEPRTGVDPITATAISPTGTVDGSGNPINDHEYTIPFPPGDIEYACIYPLPHPRDCTVAGTVCDCPTQAGVTTDNPLCDPNTPTLQIKGKAYPGTKHLAIANGLGAQGIVASVCPAQLNDSTAADYAYVPAATTILARLKTALRGK